MTLHLAAHNLLTDNGQPLPDAETTAGTAVDIAIDACRVRIVAAEDGPPAALVGQIESIRQQKDRCRLRLRVAEGIELRAEMSIAEYQRLGVNLGTAVSISLGENAARIICAPVQE